jgi:hypothetical protein
MSTLSIDNNRRIWLLLAALATLLIALAAVVLLGGPLAVGPGGLDGPQRPQALWEAQGYDHYRYTLQVGCFCMTDVTRPVVIEVRDGAVASITYADDGAPADPALFARYDTIDDLFTVIAEAASQNPARLDVTYAAETGVPLSVVIDISEQMADEELYLTVSDFQALR